MNLGYPFRNLTANLTPRTQILVCPRCHSMLKRIHRTYIDDDDHEIQREVLWKCTCASGDPIPVDFEANREDFPVGG